SYCSATLSHRSAAPPGCEASNFSSGDYLFLPLQPFHYRFTIVSRRRFSGSFTTVKANSPWHDPRHKFPGDDYLFLPLQPFHHRFTPTFFRQFHYCFKKKLSEKFSLSFCF
ncbi:MAG: hypothetical protein AB7U31_08215, partial [Synergistaceae bacterium]